MSDRPRANPYDEVPYDSKPRYATHPDCLATMATLFGMRPAPPDRCRYLEIGCATGGNLLPMAEALPHSRFVGVDLSAVQIETGRQVSSALGLENVRFEARSLLDLDETFGPFDYVAAHGVYSWVSAEVRDGLLRAIRRLLAPDGVAYVSYNTLPGWYLRAPVRDMMTFHVRALADPHEKVRQARQLLDFVARTSAASESTWARTLREEADVVRPQGDDYLFHEHLESENFPVYFEQFIAHAGAHDLRYLGEASQQSSLLTFTPEIQETLHRIAPDALRREQYLDFFAGRAFRRSLLVRGTVALRRSPQAEAVQSMRVCGAARPSSDAPDVHSAGVESYRNEDGIEIETNVPIVKSALQTLYESWPRDFGFDELFSCASGRLGLGEAAGVAEPRRGLLLVALVRLFESHLVGLHVHVPEFVVTPGGRPTTTPLIRHQARTKGVITNRRHRQVQLREIDRKLLAMLDGLRDRQELIAEVRGVIGRGDPPLAQAERSEKDLGEEALSPEREVEGALTRLAEAALLIG